MPETPAYLSWSQFLALFALIEVVYWALATAGMWTTWPTYMTFYDQLAEGLRQGHLHIPVPPNPALLAKANPYDPAHIRLWFWDMTLYDGKYYMYWGPLPGMIQAAVKAAFKINRTVGDQFLTFGFFSISAFAGSLLIRNAAWRLFPSLPKSLVVLAIAMFVFANPNPHSVSTGSVYLAAIAGGQAFIFLGMVFAFDAVWRANEGRAFAGKLCWASFSFGLALACRISTPPTVALIMGFSPLACHWPLDKTTLRSALGTQLLLGAGSIAVGFLLLYYNDARFDAWLDVGTDNQLSTMKFRLSSDYVIPNLYSYLLRPADLSCTFPYVHQETNLWQKGLPSFISYPKGYWISEPVVGMLLVVPAAWLAPFVLRPFLTALRGAKDGELSVRARNISVVWLLLCALVMALITGLPVAGLFLATMRYMADIINGVILLAIVVLWSSFLAFSQSRWRFVVRPLVLGIGVATVILGLLLGYQGYNKHFERFNPALNARLVEALSFCGDANASP
jgi:hypothetical protein